MSDYSDRIPPADSPGAPASGEPSAFSPEPERAPAGADPLAELSPTARSAVLERFLAEAHARLRDLLAAVAVEDRATVARLARGLGADAAAVGQETVRAAALALAHAAESDAEFGALALALTRALAGAPPPS